jgi:hypothetical protein
VVFFNESTFMSSIPPTLSAPSHASSDLVLPAGWLLALVLGAGAIVLVTLAMTCAIQSGLDFATQNSNDFSRRHPDAQARDRNFIRQNNITLQTASQALLVIAGLTGLAFLAWFYRMHQNLPQLGARGSLPTLVWILLLLIPGVNALIVVGALLELWWKSDPGRFGGIGIQEKPKEPTVIFVWWLLGAACAGISIYLRLNPLDMTDLDNRMNFAVLQWVKFGCILVQQGLFVLMLNNLMTFQTRRRELLVSSSLPA